MYTGRTAHGDSNTDSKMSKSTITVGSTSMKIAAHSLGRDLTLAGLHRFIDAAEQQLPKEYITADLLELKSATKLDMVKKAVRNARRKVEMCGLCDTVGMVDPTVLEELVRSEPVRNLLEAVLQPNITLLNERATEALSEDTTGFGSPGGPPRRTFSYVKTKFPVRISTTTTTLLCRRRSCSKSSRNFGPSEWKSMKSKPNN